jgi:patatin-like phospholipase/acyl hydrolase
MGTEAMIGYDKWEGPLQILSLDGGGVKGLFSAAVLANLEADLKTNVVDHFDLIAGTSTGGIIAIALGLGLSPKEIVDSYTQDGPKIFRVAPGVSRCKHAVCCKHNPSLLEAALKRRYGDKKTLGDSRKRLVIPAYNLDQGTVHVFKTPHHERLRRDHRVLAWQAAMATAAAPTYFPVFRGVDGARLVDGGVWANNPSMVAVAEASGSAVANTHPKNDVRQIGRGKPTASAKTVENITAGTPRPPQSGTTT